jgi:hypothetical protein
MPLRRCQPPAPQKVLEKIEQTQQNKQFIQEEINRANLQISSTALATLKAVESNPEGPATTPGLSPLETRL